MEYTFGEIHKKIEQEESFESKTEAEIDSFISGVASEILNDSLDALEDGLKSRRESQGKIWNIGEPLLTSLIFILPVT
ncbi:MULTISPECIES: hypothetical protein [unclassified Pseudoalteromonas]|uniref:hypothetical protein n=1 Tax=unclassified Pseudoalteromonas TaxID=194690 RepID=UPI00390CC9F9|nr:hypothetical protein [Ningiella sp. W23]